MNQKFIPLSVPVLEGNELKYVTEAIKSGWVSSSGHYVGKFENALSEYVGTEGGVACQSGTAGIHLALILSGVTKDDLVIVPTLTFIATVNPVKYVGAAPVFMDCDDSLCMDPIKLRHFCENECKLIDGRLFEKKTMHHVKAVIVVHVFGNMADMEEIMDIAKQYHLIVIEDAAEALGTYYLYGRYKGKFAGTIGDFGVFSFNGNKIITTGGGGMLVAQKSEFLKRAKHLTTQAKVDEINFIHDEIGYNYRMTNLQAAVGLAQLEQLEEFIAVKVENYSYYVKKVEDIKGLRMMPFREGVRCNHWFYSLFCDNTYVYSLGQLQQLFLENLIQVRPVWKLVHTQKPYIGDKHYKISKAEYYWKHIVNMPSSVNLVKQDIDTIFEQLEH